MKIAIQFQSKVKYPFKFIVSVCNGEASESKDLVGVQYTGIMHEGDSMEMDVPDMKLTKVKPG